MRYLGTNRPRRLRWHLLQPLTITFLLLWLGTMLLFTSNTCHDLETSVNTTARLARNSMEEQCGFYTRNIDSGLGREADHILSQNLSSLSLGQVSELDGGMAFAVRTETGYARSQLTWGWGNQEGIDTGQRWYFTFDEGLDDIGQLALANWIIKHRADWDYTIYPIDDSEYGYGNNDGRFARVTGIERPGYEIAVQKIEIVHPDGSVDVMVNTATEGEGKVWDFTYLCVRSVLLPSWSSSGKDGYINMERRLSSFQEAQAILEREIAGERRSVLKKGGFALGSSDSLGIVNYVAVQCQVLPAALRQETGLYISTALLTLLVLAVLSAKLSRQVTLPVETLCREVEEGNCYCAGSIQELNTLANAFRTAQQKLEQQLKREREFTRSAAHELKTPLAILRAHAECAREDIAPEKRAGYLDIVLEESDRMADLVNCLLELARLESGLVLKAEPVALAPLIRDALEPMTLIARQKEILLSMMLEELWVEGDRRYLHKIVTNLTSNALRHTPDGGTIQVSLSRQNDTTIITVDNDGLPVPEDALSRLWEPFYRVDQSRSRSDGGTGLGLAIVYHAVLAHGGSCEVKNRPGGVCFKISIPQ